MEWLEWCLKWLEQEPLFTIGMGIVVVLVVIMLCIGYGHERAQRRREALPPLYFNVRLRDGTFLYDKEDK